MGLHKAVMAILPYVIRWGPRALAACSKACAFSRDSAAKPRNTNLTGSSDLASLARRRQRVACSRKRLASLANGVVPGVCAR
jgi:hypothetical protein